MNTEDNITLDFFKETNVEVFLQARDIGGDDFSSNSFVTSSKQSFTNFCFTHHQKTVVADAPVQGDPKQRKLVAFIGGLDLTAGRYDSPEHPLFRTLVHEHKDDFRNR